MRAGAGIALVDSLAQRSGLFPDLAYVPLDPPIRIRTVMLSLRDEIPSLSAVGFAEAVRPHAALYKG